MTNFDRLSWQHKCLIIYKSIVVYSVEGCCHGSLVISVAMQRMVAMVISQCLVQGLKYQMK